MPKRRTRKQITGGNPTETKFREYASKIANKEPVSIESFTAFLDSIDDPLKMAIDYDKKGKPYTVSKNTIVEKDTFLSKSTVHNKPIELRFHQFFKILRISLLFI